MSWPLLLLGEITAWIGMFIARLAGLATGRTFDLPPKKAQAIGEWLIVAVFAGALIAITVIYS
ncbi:MAG: hypothetical protein LBE81_03200 [Azonexus sp.]|jgi:uncharacterized protein (DUF3084 family)|uniref:hypothetical protein n=1 Tax=Azonexus sp. TaxID=1872668 RepID=UPI002829744E|nr:hypothetical protein [Azonexus sp.]MDR0775629.1 hypothetical protein [Azonexus sp.]